ncbi:MAG: signal peptidase II, partial [Burkholderiales bacterium]
MAKGSAAAMKPWLWLAATIVVVDQLTKLAVERSFAFGERLAIVPGLFDLTLVYN